MSVKRTTHTWLKPLYDNLDGIDERPLGSSTGMHGFYGQTGIAQVASGGIAFANPTNLSVSGIAATGVGNSGLYFHVGRMGFDGGSGTIYTINDVVTQLKNAGFLIR